MNKRARKKLQRAAPGGALMYVPAGVQQSTYGTTFYGNTLKNLPVGQTALFSPGAPLPTQQGVNPLGLPVQYRYPIAVNTFPVDRTQQQDDIPSFEQLRRLARLDYGINLCERYWLDLVPRMTLSVVLRPEVVAQGAEEKDYQKEITYFKNFFSKPDGEHNWHEWIQMGLREQSQVDDLYIYKNRTRGGNLLGLRLVAADQMKPLLDDWGYTPAPPKYAYQQYPWGIPGALYTRDMMIHKRETPAVDDPYGMSRVERVILMTNIALRKAKMDLAYYTDGNIPSGIMEVPEAVNWTPDQIDSYEQSWNALMAGNLQQLRRIKFVQPGMKYTPFVQPAFDSVFDRYLLNIRASVYGVPMDELGFTETSNRSVGESQEAMVYRRTIEPFAVVYGSIFTECMETDFDPSLHGDMLMVKFGGYEEGEDEQTKATTLTTYTSAGVLGLSAAAKLANLPEEPGAPQIGRVFMGKDGPVFLDDMAQPDMRKAQQQAQLAGFKMAANPPQQQPAAGGNAPQDNGNGGDEVDQAMDEADQSLGQLSRSDPVHGFHGEFGFDGGAAQSHTGSGRHSGRHGHSKGHGHHTKGPHLSPRDSMHQRAQKLAARFGKLENRKLGHHWSAAQSKAAGKLEGIFNQISSAMAKGGQQQSIDHLLDKAYSEAKTLFAGKPKGFASMSRALTRIDKANDGGLFRMVGAEIDDEDENEFDDLDDALDELETEEETTSRVVDVLASIDEQLRLLRAVNITPEEEYIEQRTPQDPASASRVSGDSRRGTVEDARAGTQPDAGQTGEAGSDPKEVDSAEKEFREPHQTMNKALNFWRSRVLQDLNFKRSIRPFTSSSIPIEIQVAIQREIECCVTVDDVYTVFRRAKEGDTSFFAPAASDSNNGGHPQPSKSAWKLRW